jgi:RNA polymerase sigma-70 factor (ECF subfamily)
VRPSRKTATFEKLFLPHLDGAYNLARWIVERDPDAQAVVQEAFIQASRAFEEFREADARAWLLAIVRNVAHTWIQKRGNNSSMIPFEETIHVASLDKPQPDLFNEHRKRPLHAALSRLPVEFREVLVRREIEGWSYQQLASALNVPSAAVMSRLSQARRHLRQEEGLLQIGASTSVAHLNPRKRLANVECLAMRHRRV